MKKERGITLVALIITIIILVILSAVTIQNTIGEHGLIDMATDAAIRTRIAEYKDELDQIGIIIMTENAPKNLTGREYLEEFKKKVDESELFKDKRSAEIIGGEEGETEEKLRVVTKEGFVYDVTEKEIKYVGSVGEEGFKPLPEIKEGSIKIALDKNDWTKEIPIHATITVNDVAEEDLSSLIIQYTRDPEAKTGWKTYAQGSKIDIETNGVIFARVMNNIGETSKTASKTISIIDTISPENPSGTVKNKNTNSITVIATAKDGAATTDKPGEESGVAKIIFALQGEGEPQEKTVTATGTAEVTAECTFEQLKQNKEYTITVYAVDKAENESAITEITETTGTVPGGEDLKDGNITFTYASESTEGIDGWTKGPVNVTITSTYTGQGYTLQYTTKSPTENDWNDYGDGPVKMTTNGTIYARLKDSTNQTGAASTATGSVSNIDTIVPGDPTEGTVTNKTTNSITVTAKAKDGDPIPGTKPGEQSGIAKIKFEITGQIGGTTKTESQEKTVTITKPSDTAEAECIFTGLTQTQSYTIKATAVDKAENESAITEITETTGTVPGGNDLKDGNIAFAYDKDGWTKGPVNVTITSTYTGQGYTLQYTTKAPVENDWKDYGSGPVKMTTNGTIYARLKDSTGQLGTASTATGTVSNIDTISPKNPTSVTAVAVEGTDGKKNCIKVEATAQDGDVTTGKPGEQSGIAKIQVQIDSGSWTDVTATSENGGKVTGNYTSASQTGGAHTIQVKAIDKAGNESSAVSADSVTIDVTPPSAPTITVTDGEKVDQATYAKNITVTITPGVDSGEGATGTKETKYSITGADTLSGTIEGTEKKEITLTKDGDYTITATSTDVAGNASESVTKQVMKRIVTFGDPYSYGDYVNYPVELDIGDPGTQDDWKIFYKNDDGITFIIATDNVPKSIINDAAIAAGMTPTSTSVCNWCWADPPSTLDPNYDPDILKLFSINNIYSLSETLMSSRCVSGLLSTDHWKYFKNSIYADCAIGSPTIEMWCASWNSYLKVNPNSNLKEITADYTDQDGYSLTIDGLGTYSCVSVDGRPNSLQADGTLWKTISTDYSLYFPPEYTEDRRKWLLVGVSFV